MRVDLAKAAIPSDSPGDSRRGTAGKARLGRSREVQMIFFARTASPLNRRAADDQSADSLWTLPEAAARFVAFRRANLLDSGLTGMPPTEAEHGWCRDPYGI